MLARSARRCEPIKYYPINETAARRAKEMNSFSDYREGSATAEYRAMVDKAAAVAEHQKARVDPCLLYTSFSWYGRIISPRLQKRLGLSHWYA